MGEDERRVGFNESLFRDVNERIVELGNGFDVAETEFVCECADSSCTSRLVASLAEYEAIRANPQRFLVLPGHERADVERVVENRDRYLVVEKFGEAGEIAEQTDPRD